MKLHSCIYDIVLLQPSNFPPTPGSRFCPGFRSELKPAASRWSFIPASQGGETLPIAWQTGI